MGTAIKAELDRQMNGLPPEAQRRVLDFARALASARPRGVPGKHLLKFSGAIPADDLKAISRAIEDGCEQVDADGW
jgi:hypothetical protein